MLDAAKLTQLKVSN